MRKKGDSLNEAHERSMAFNSAWNEKQYALGNYRNTMELMNARRTWYPSKILRYARDLGRRELRCGKVETEAEYVNLTRVAGLQSLWALTILSIYNPWILRHLGLKSWKEVTYKTMCKGFCTTYAILLWYLHQKLAANPDDLKVMRTDAHTMCLWRNKHVTDCWQWGSLAFFHPGCRAVDIHKNEVLLAYSRDQPQVATIVEKGKAWTLYLYRMRLLSYLPFDFLRCKSWANQLIKGMNRRVLSSVA